MFGRKELERRINEMNERLGRQQEIIEELLRETVKKEDIEGIVSRSVLSVKVNNRATGQQLILPELRELNTPSKQGRREEWFSIAEEYGLVIDRRKKKINSLAAITTVRQIYVKNGEDHLRSVFRVIKGSFGFNRTTTKSEFIQNISRFILNYSGNKRYYEQRLIATLRSIGTKSIEEHFYLDGTADGKKSFHECTEFIRRSYNKEFSGIDERIL
jgi:hypothetical protein